MQENRDLLDISSAAKLLGISKLTLRNWDNSGTLKAVRIGNRGDRRYKREDIEKLLSQEKQGLQEADKKGFLKYIEENEFWLEEGSMLPLTVEAADIKMAEMGKYFKPGIKFCIFFIENGGFGYQALSVEESIKTSQAQFDAIKNNPEKINSFKKDCYTQFEELEKATTRLNFINLNSLSKERLLKEFNNFNKSLEDFWQVLLIVEPLAPYLDNVYIPKFKKIVGNTKTAREALSTLTLPNKPSFIAQEKIDSLKLILKFLNTSKKQKQLLNTKDEDYLAEIKINQPEFFEALLKHQRDYLWIQNSYAERIIITINNFLEFTRETIKESSTENLRSELERLEDKETLIKKQQELIKELKLDDLTIKEIDYIKEATWIKDERKRLVLMMLHQMFEFIEEFSKRTGKNKILLGHAKIEELPKILDNNFNINILKERVERVFILSETGNRLSMITGNEAVMLKEKLFPEEKENLLKEEIHGNTACRGSESAITGKAKVVLDSKNQKINPDEILITSMTRPDFVPLMKKAKAIVTNEGGITCHAAIVSREMNKPCIIGTKNATKTLKTGDEIELRMNHGVVKIIKRA